MSNLELSARFIGGAGQFFIRCAFEHRAGQPAALVVAADPHSYVWPHWQQFGNSCHWILAGALVKYRIWLNGVQLFAGPPRPVEDGVAVKFRYELPETLLRDGGNVIGLLCRGEKQGVAAVLECGEHRFATGSDAWRLLRAENFVVPYDWSCPAMNCSTWRGGPGPGETPEFIDGEHYPVNWTEPGFDDSGWETALAGPAAGGPFELTSLKPVTVTPHAPAAVKMVAPDRVLLDFGSEYFGTLEVFSPSAALIEIRLGEELLDNGEVRFQMRTGNVYQERWRFPSGGGRLSGFGLRAFRYAELLDVPENFDPGAVRLLESVYPFDDKASQFDCSDARLVKVWELCKNSLRRTGFDVYMDCPSRERLAYEADALVTMQSDFAFQPNYAFARRAIRYQMNHYTWPCEWRQLMPEVVEKYTMESGDTTLAAELYDRLVSECSFLERFDGNLIENWPQRVIVDWPLPCRDNCDFGPRMAVPNAHAYNGWKRLAQLGRLIGRTADAERFDAAAQQLKADFLNRLFDPERGVCRDRADSGHAALHSTLFALAFGLIPDEYVSRCADFVVSRGMVCSVYGAQYLLNVLFDCDRDREAVALMTSDSDRSWLGMIRNGATICTEAWNPVEKPNMSFAHPWSSSPANVIVHKLFGLNPTKPGWEEFDFHPRTGDLADGRLTVTTACGRIRAEFSSVGAHVEVL